MSLTVRGASPEKFIFFYAVALGTDDSNESYYALAEGTDPAIASVYMDMAILINVTGTYDVSFDTVSKTVGIVPAT